MICALLPQEVVAKPAGEEKKKKLKKGYLMCAILILSFGCNDCCSMYGFNEAEGSRFLCVCQDRPERAHGRLSHMQRNQPWDCYEENLKGAKPSTQQSQY